MVGFFLEGTIFDLSNVNVNCPQVVSKILFYNEMLSNLDHDCKGIGKSPKVRYVGISRQKGDLVSNTGENRRRK
jgi:hypothetical protein